MDDLDGSFARFARVPADRLLPIPEGLDTRGAALAEPLAVALHGINRSGVQPGDSVMIFGAGPIGALTLAALVARGIGPICMVEPTASRAELAAALGADEVIGPDELEVFDRFQPEHIAARAAHVVLECSGKRAAMEAGFNQLRRGGTMALVGAGVDHPTFDPNRFLLNELTVCGSFVYDARRLRGGPGPAGLGRPAPGPPHRSGRRAARPTWGTPSRGWSRAGSPPRRWCRPD